MIVSGEGVAPQEWSVTPLDPARVRQLRRQAIFVAGKLDPQAFDRSAIAPFAVRLKASTWATLAHSAEQAFAELLEVERALATDARAWRWLDIDPVLRRVLDRAREAGGRRDLRVARFDFHPTADGWRISEVNADVPGGYIEAGVLTRLAAEFFPECDAPPDPAEVLAKAVSNSLAGGTVALVHATAFVDDQQVVRRMGEALAQHGVASVMAAPDHLERGQGGGPVRLATTGQAVDGVIRFYPGEWLSVLPRRGAWARVLADPALPQVNPLTALLLQSKRLPIVMEQLGLSAPCWSALTPRSAAIGARRFAWHVTPPGWVLKPVWGRVGGGVVVHGATPSQDVRDAEHSARLWPRSWVLQERFTPMAVEAGDDANGSGGEPSPSARGRVPSRPTAVTDPRESSLPSSQVHLCLGIFVVEGRAAGVYARASERALIDGRAMDVPVLLDRESVRPQRLRESHRRQGVPA
ncbi:MAG: glutathionylspermidine synthase family protein [Phycisphaeraceae bacterium]|nr:glutathionylspermidine synthase family protein [Phycisphaeraceae bacterium]